MVEALKSPPLKRITRGCSGSRAVYVARDVTDTVEHVALAAGVHVTLLTQAVVWRVGRLHCKIGSSAFLIFMMSWMAVSARSLARRAAAHPPTHPHPLRRRRRTRTRQTRCPLRCCAPGQRRALRAAATFACASIMASFLVVASSSDSTRPGASASAVASSLDHDGAEDARVLSVLVGSNRGGGRGPGWPRATLSVHSLSSAESLPERCPTPKVLWLAVARSGTDARIARRSSAVPRPWTREAGLLR